MCIRRTVTSGDQGGFEKRFVDTDEAFSDYGDTRSIAELIAEQSDPNKFEDVLGLTDNGIRFQPALDLDENFDDRRAGERSFKHQSLTAVFDSSNRHRF